MYEAAKTVSNEARKVLALLKDAVEQSGGIEWDGQRLEVSESAPPVQVEFKPAEEFLREQMGAQLLDVLSVSTTKLKKAVMDEAPKGEKKAAWQSFLRDLKKLNAVTLGTPRKTLKVTKAKED